MLRFESSGVTKSDERIIYLASLNKVFERRETKRKQAAGVDEVQLLQVRKSLR
jgi:hypothetical protein